MKLIDVKNKNETSKAVCMVLGGRQRNRPEPLAIRRLEYQVKAFATEHDMKYDRGEFFVCIKDLAEMGHCSIIPNRLGRPKSLEFKKSINEFKKELEGIDPKETKVAKIEVPFHTIPKALTTTKFVIEVVGGKATIEIEGDVEHVMRRLRAIL